MKQRIRLTESDLHRIVKESVDSVLRENNGFMDGVKAAWNGYKGGAGWGRAMQGIKRGYQQGAQGQQQMLTQNAQSNANWNMKYLVNDLQRLSKLASQGNWEQFTTEMNYHISDCQEILKSLSRKASGGVDYYYDGPENQYS